MTRTLVLWLDAFRRDYLDKGETTFLSSIAERFGAAALKPEFGYSAIGASFVTGLRSQRHGQFALYGYDRNHRPDPLLNLLPQKLAPSYYNLKRYLMGKDFLAPLPSPKMCRHFVLTQDRYYHQRNALGVESVFDMLRDRNIPFVVYNWPVIGDTKGSRISKVRSNDTNRTREALKLCNKDYQACFFHLWDLDKVGHAYGPDSPEMCSALRQQDQLAESIVSRFDMERDNIVIWSDHGMVPVKEEVHLMDKLPPFGDGYVFFLDSTMARFWFFDDSRRKEVQEILRTVPGGRLLTSEDMHSFGVPQRADLYGEMMFLCDSGNLLIPNFWQATRIPGMHGYDHSDFGELGIMMANQPIEERANVIDILPTLLDMMGIEHEGLDGVSVIKSKVV